VSLQLDELARRLESRGIRIELTDAARSYLAEKGYDPAYGARPLKRLIQREIENPLALALLEGKFRDGDAVSVDVEADGLVFRK
jgi:ATP-dependent Clp protease ATP-binding subunit ClpB